MVIYASWRVLDVSSAFFRNVHVGQVRGDKPLRADQVLRELAV